MVSTKLKLLIFICGLILAVAIITAIDVNVHIRMISFLGLAALSFLFVQLFLYSPIGRLVNEIDDIIYNLADPSASIEYVPFDRFSELSHSINRLVSVMRRRDIFLSYQMLVLATSLSMPRVVKSIMSIIKENNVVTDADRRIQVQNIINEIYAMRSSIYDRVDHLIPEWIEEASRKLDDDLMGRIKEEVVPCLMDKQVTDDNKVRQCNVAIKSFVSAYSQRMSDIIDEKIREEKCLKNSFPHN